MEDNPLPLASAAPANSNTTAMTMLAVGFIAPVPTATDRAATATSLPPLTNSKPKVASAPAATSAPAPIVASSAAGFRGESSCSTLRRSRISEYVRQFCSDCQDYRHWRVPELSAAGPNHSRVQRLKTLEKLLERGFRFLFCWSHLPRRCYRLRAINCECRACCCGERQGIP
jgi:hypothetical protein